MQDKNLVKFVLFALLAATLGCSSLEPIDVNGSTYNVQFLTPSWYSDSSTIDSSHWPNTTERATEIAEHALECGDFLLLQETVNRTRRTDILSAMNAKCGGPGYTMITLQHDWDVVEAVLSAGDYLDALIGLAADELNVSAEDLGVDDIFGDDGLTGVGGALSAVSEPTPLIHEEVGVMTSGVVISANQLEFSRASGPDRFAAKGALHVRAHLSTRPELPSARPLPVEPEAGTPCIDVLSGCEDDGPIIVADDSAAEGGANVDVFVTHLNADSRPHAVQVDELVAFVDRLWDRNLPLVVAGDFNISLDSDAFDQLCRDLKALTPGDSIQFADVGATNNEGWDKTTKAPSTSVGKQIDHVFVHGFRDKPTFARSYNPIRPFNPPAGLVADGFQRLSDHAEIEFRGGKVTASQYPDRAPVSVDRTIHIEIHAVHDAGDDGCGAPDPKGSVRLATRENATAVSFGPADDRATLDVNKSVSLDVSAGVRLASLFVDLAEHDAGFCGSDDEIDIDPDPTRTNAAIDLDLTWDGGIQINGRGLGWYGQPARLEASGNWISFTATIVPR